MTACRKTRQSLVEPGAARDLTFSCYHRLPLLNGDTIKGRFLENLERARTRLGFEVWAYVLMPEHVHLLVFPVAETCTVQCVLSAVKQPVARWALRHLRARRSPLLEKLEERYAGSPLRHRFWQRGGGYDRTLVSSEAIRNSVEYFHQNPVKRGLVKSALDWKWSSCRQYEEFYGDLPFLVDPYRL